MSSWNKPPDLLTRVRELERKTKKKSWETDFDPDQRPGPVPGVTLDFRIREKKVKPRYSAVVRWGALAPGTCEADIHYYKIQIRATDSIGNIKPTGDGRRKRGNYLVNDPEDLEADELKYIFHDLEHPKKWYWQARVCVVDKANRKGEWSAWTDPELPHAEANPLPPAPQNLAVTFDKNEKDRHEPRWRLIAKFDEIAFWDVPPTADTDKVVNTLSGQHGAGATEFTFSSTSGFPTPLNKERISLKVGYGENREIISYNAKTATKLQNVKRGLDGTTAAVWPDGTDVILSATDAQERQNDIERYECQIRRCDANGNWVTDAEGKFIHRMKGRSWDKEDDDNDSKVRVVFPNIRKRHKWQVRARTIDRFNRKGDWSDWFPGLAPGSYASPSDNTPPPQPSNVIVAVDNNKVHVDWDFEPDPDDAELQHPDIAYYQVQLFDNSTYTGDPVKKDMYQNATKKTFKVKKAQNQYWARVRSVDGSGNKSAWVQSNASKARPPQPSAPSAINFDTQWRTKGARIDALVSFAYNEAGYDEDHIDRYIVQMVINSTASMSGTENRRRQVIDLGGDADEGDANDPKVAKFVRVKRFKWCTARVRAVDKNNRKSPWSLWSAWHQVGDFSAPPGPFSVTVESDVKGVLVQWEDPTDAGDGDAADLDIDHYQVQVHGNSTFTNLLKKDRHQVGTKKRFKGLAEGGTYYARVRSVSTSGTKSGWVGSNGVVTAPVVDRPSVVDNAINRDKVEDDAIGTAELDDGGTIVGTGTWRNSSGATRVEIRSDMFNAISMRQSGITYEGGLFTSGDSIFLGAPHSALQSVGINIDESDKQIDLTAINETVASGISGVRALAGFHMPGSQVAAGDTFGVSFMWGGISKRYTAPSSVTIGGNLGQDSNVSGSPDVIGLHARGGIFRATANAGGSFLRCMRELTA